MARLTDEQRELILADFHTGQYSQRQLATLHKVSSRTINILVRDIEPKHKDKVNTSIAIKTALAEESKHEVNAVNREIEERTKHILLFQNSASRNQVVANKVLTVIEDKDKVDEKDLYSLDAHSRITQRNKETVLGKDKTVELNKTNAQQNNKEIKIKYR